MLAKMYLNFGALSSKIVEDEPGSGLPDSVQPSGHTQLHISQGCPVGHVIVLGHKFRQRRRDVILMWVGVLPISLLYVIEEGVGVSD